jgi:hypothetical protein
MPRTKKFKPRPEWYVRIITKGDLELNLLIREDKAEKKLKELLEFHLLNQESAIQNLQRWKWAMTKYQARKNGVLTREFPHPGPQPPAPDKLSVTTERIFIPNS